MPASARKPGHLEDSDRQGQAQDAGARHEQAGNDDRVGAIPLGEISGWNQAQREKQIIGGERHGSEAHRHAGRRSPPPA